jgi:tetratricopeptide (TPR) repeat protein/GTPase SAR1 family protein
MNDRKVLLLEGETMTLDSQLIKKAYYEMFINEHEDLHPVRVLGELFQEEQQKDVPDLSYIRFAQGEVYFHHKDFESAIFKWGNITNELEPWAKKNMGDAYYALGLLPTAEDLYKSIQSDNLTLMTETALQLFSLYIERGKTDAASQIIKKTIVENPDYPDVTELARAFFEEHQDYASAIELAVSEAVRTESVQWFDILKTYVDQGVTNMLAPSYFSETLRVLYGLDQIRFETLVLTIWNSYKEEETYFSWLQELNQLLLGLDLNRSDSWPELSRILKNTYFALIDGKYLINQLQDLVPGLLTNWVRITDSTQAVLAATAVMSWAELFPASIASSTMSDAENLFSHSKKTVNEFNECIHLFESIMEWAEFHDMGANLRLKWTLSQILNFETDYLFIAGLSGSGKSSFVNFVLGQDLLPEVSTSSLVVFKDDEDLKINEITDWEIAGLSDISDFQERLQRRRNALESILEYKEENQFLNENHLAVMDTPALSGNPYEQNEVLKYLTIADAILFVLDATAPFTEKEQTILSKLHNYAPEVPVHFLLNKMDSISNEDEAIRIFEETSATIHSYLPNAKIFAFSSHYDRNQQLSDLNEFMRSIRNTKNREDQRLSKLLTFIRSTITTLLQKRIDVENQMMESVQWNEEIVIKLNGALNQLSDVEVQKTKVITRSYRLIKESVQKEISESIPKLLRECAKLVKEDSNFSRIHLELNDEMNKRIQDYLEKTVLPKFYQSLNGWIAASRNEFEQGQLFLDEMAEGFNTLYGEERIKFTCDFKVLDDWRRDMDRMTSRLQLENVNILLRRTPSQLLIKSAGKLFGAIQNKSMLFNRYKTFIETEDYSEPTELVIKQFFQQFELFEKSLERDITMFFRDPQSELRQAAEDSRSEIETNKEGLRKMNTNPELYRDPLTLFEVKLRQFEWMTVSGRGVSSIS